MDTKKPGRPPKSGGKSLTKRIEFRALDQEHDQYVNACRIRGQELSDWIRATLNVAAIQTIEEHGNSTSNLKKPKDGVTTGPRPRQKRVVGE